MKYIETMLWWKNREWKKSIKFNQFYKQKYILMQMRGKQKKENLKICILKENLGTW
jgi:methyltransferase-like protein